MANTTKRKSSPSKPPQNDGDVKAFWDDQAKQHGGSDLATAPDHHYRGLEIDAIIRVIKAIKHDNILDVGCGNGYTAFAIAKAFPEANVVGVDFSEPMIKQAHKDTKNNTEFMVGDVLSLSREPGLKGQLFDVVLSSRCLINLSNWEEQKVGILEMRKMLEPEGRMILVENIQDGLDNLNQIRATVGLEPIKTRWHNRYLVQDEISKFLASIQGQLLTTEYVENIGNFYYLASRVLYAKMCKDQGIEPDYNNQINDIASKMPTMGEHYACSPNFLFVLKNEGPPWVSKKTLS
jgi:ubiquinone/menaquinone biosynthesis C-methylase UbiE